MLTALVSSLRDRSRVSLAVREILRVQIGLLAAIAAIVLLDWSGHASREDVALPMLLSTTSCLFLLGLGLGIEGAHLALRPRPSNEMAATMMFSVSVGMIVTSMGSMLASGMAIAVTIWVVLSGLWA